MVKPIGKTFFPLTTIAPFSSIETFEPSCAVATDGTGRRQINISSAHARQFIGNHSRLNLATDGHRLTPMKNRRRFSHRRGTDEKTDPFSTYLCSSMPHLLQDQIVFI